MAGRARQKSDRSHARAGQAPRARRARRQHGGGIARDAHGDGGENGAFDGHDDGKRDRADSADGGRVGREMGAQRDDGEAGRRSVSAGAAGRRASGAHGRSENGELHGVDGP